LHMYNHYYDSRTPLPFLLIETWNDFEEGTAIEKGAIPPGCGNDNGPNADPMLPLH
jgi:hypothetical protein